MGDRKSGVYLIVNQHTGQFYVGRSKDVYARIASHSWYLREGIHPNHKIQADWESGHAFSFLLLQREMTHKLVDLEQHFLDEFQPQYNIATRALGPMAGRRHSPETLIKLSECQSGERNGMFGKRHTSDTRKQISEKNRGRVCSPVTREKLRLSGKKHAYWRGKRLPEETRRKISTKIPKTPVICSNGHTYPSQLEAAKLLRVPQGHISEVVRGIRAHAGGYKFWRKKNA